MGRWFFKNGAGLQGIILIISVFGIIPKDLRHDMMGFLFELTEYMYLSIRLMYNNTLLWLKIIRPTLKHINLLLCYFGNYEAYHFLESNDTLQFNKVHKYMINIKHESNFTRLNVYFYVNMLNAKMLSFLKLDFSLIPFLVQALFYPIGWACVKFTNSLNAY